jgi:hypothetical protein
MKKLVNAVAVAALVLSASAASAQDINDAGVFADAAGTQSTLNVVPFVAFDIYAVAFIEGGVLGYEFGINGLDGLVVLAGFPTVNPGPVLDLGDPNIPGVKEFIVATGGCLPEEAAGAFVMARVNVANFFQTDVTDRALCMIPASTSSFADASGEGALPGWLRCDGLLTPFGVAQNSGGLYPNGCLILNATQEGPVATEATSFGEMKARF